MQQKNLKYILLTGVAIIWGAIIYKVLNGMSNENRIITLIPKQKNNIIDKSLNEPYRLLANYADPFGAEGEEELNKNFKDSSKNSANSLQEKAVLDNRTVIKPDLSFIQYKGMITNPVSKKRIAIISINGKDEFVGPKTRINNIKVNTIQQDKISIIYLKSQYWIKRMKA